MEGIVDEAIDKASDKLEESADRRSASLLALNNAEDLDEELLMGAMNFDQLVTTLRALTNLLPTATNTLKLARTEVSKAASNMDSVFKLFETKAPAIFEKLAMANKILWTAYYFFLVPLSLLMLYYGFWAGGYFGGPQPLTGADDYQEPVTWTEKLGVCYRSCGSCLSNFHDTQMCFWSCIIVMQVLVLVVFLVSIVLCILAGVQAFITSGCAQIYILGDQKVCAASLGNLQNFVGSFWAHILSHELEPRCSEQALLTCSLITSKMKSSAALTTIFSFAGTILSLQMLIESAVLHEMARYRRLANAEK